MNKTIGISAFIGVVLAFSMFMITGAGNDPAKTTSKTLYIHKGTTFDSTTTTDTSAVYDIGERVYIRYSSYYTGGTSSSFTVYMLGNVGGNYIPVHSWTATTNAYNEQLIRTQDLDSLGAIDKVKFATTMTIGDSLGTSDLYYYGNCQLQ